MNQPVPPKPAASILLVRAAPPGAAEPLEVYMVRRHRGMRFLGGYWAFPGGKVDPDDASAAAFARCRGLDPTTAAALLEPDDDTPPPLAYWVAVVRELLEESGVLLAADGADRRIEAGKAEVAAVIERMRQSLVGGESSFSGLLADAGWHCDLRPLRYVSHYITPKSSPIRFSARFFLCPVPHDQAPRLFTEETSEAAWIAPGEGHRRFRAGAMAMAEPAEYGLAYLAQFGSADELWAAHADGREKFRGTIDRIDVFWDRFDWKQNRWPEPHR
jgi:8-oxo-dGTP pyrophosphatase MutT (NUDIX family)